MTLKYNLEWPLPSVLCFHIDSLELSLTTPWEGRYPTAMSMQYKKSWLATSPTTQLAQTLQSSPKPYLQNVCKSLPPHSFLPFFTTTLSTPKSKTKYCQDWYMSQKTPCNLFKMTASSHPQKRIVALYPNSVFHPDFRTSGGRLMHLSSFQISTVDSKYTVVLFYVVSKIKSQFTSSCTI